MFTSSYSCDSNTKILETLAPTTVTQLISKKTMNRWFQIFITFYDAYII